MADRKASVALELHAGQFKTETRTVERRIDDVDRKVEDLDRDITKIPPDAARAGAALKLLGGDASVAGNRLQSIGDKATALDLLDQKIMQSRAEVRKLADEFIRTGDVDVFAKLSKASGQSHALAEMRSKLVKQMKDAGQEGATTFASLIQGGIISAFRAMPPQAKAAVAAAIVGLAAAAAPLVTAAIGGVILGGVGAGGLVGGIMLAARDERVGKAWAEVGESARFALAGVGAPFVMPLVQAARMVRAEVGPLGVQLHDALLPLSRTVPSVTSGLLTMADRAMPGLTRASATAELVVNDLADELPRLGESVSDFFESVSDGSEGAIMGLRFLLRFVGANVEAIGTLIEYGSKGFEKFARFGEDVAHLFGAEGTLDRARTHAMHWGDAVAQSGDKVALTADRVKELDAALAGNARTAEWYSERAKEKLFDTLMGLDRATHSWHRSLRAVKESLSDNGRALDLNSEKGLDNREAILGAVSANMQLYQANIQAGMTAEDAADQYDAGTRALEKQMRQAGLTQGQIDGLIGKYRGIPALVDTDIAVNGLTAAINGLADLIRRVNGLDGKVADVTVRTTYIYRGQQGQSRGLGTAMGRIRYAQEGMIVPPSDPGTLIVGEPQTGGEAWIPLRGITQSRAMQLMKTVGNAYGLEVTPRNSRPLMAMSRAGQPTGGSMPRELVLNATFIDPTDGGTIRKQVIRWSLDRGMNPANAFTTA